VRYDAEILLRKCLEAQGEERTAIRFDGSPTRFGGSRLPRPLEAKAGQPLLTTATEPRAKASQRTVRPTYQQGATVTALGNTGSLVNTGYSLGGWNTAANGSGTSYAPGATFSISANVTLYAQWINFLYVANEFSGSVSAYTIGSNGALTQLSGSPNPFGVAVSPNGSYLYVTNIGSNNVSAYSIGSNGALTALSGSQFPAGTNPCAW
jgi:hypothetical protein